MGVVGIPIIDLNLWMTWQLILEEVNLLVSNSYKTVVISDIPVQNQLIPAEHLKTEYIENKTRSSVSNFT